MGEFNWEGIAELTYAAYRKKLMACGMGDPGSWAALTHAHRAAWIDAAQECADIYVKAATA